jgi:hypothetical protein
MNEPTTEPGTVQCKHCGATNVYWMTVLGRREAEFIAKNGNPRALKLAKARLYNVDGGEHVCPVVDEFDALDD